MVAGNHQDRDPAVLQGLQFFAQLLQTDSFSVIGQIPRDHHRIGMPFQTQPDEFICDRFRVFRDFAVALFHQLTEHGAVVVKGGGQIVNIGPDPDLQRLLWTCTGLHGGDPGAASQNGEDARRSYDFFQYMIAHRFHYSRVLRPFLNKNASK